MGLFDQYIPPDVPSGAVDPQELERAKYLAMIRAGLGVANREPLQNAFGGGLKAYIGAQANSRQQMLAQLQAYKERQEIGAKAKAMQQNEALQGDLKNVFGSAPITEAGGPTPANATLAAIDQYERAAVRFAVEGKDEAASRMAAIARDMKEKYSTTPQYFIGADGKLQMAQLSERGNTKILPGTPAEEKSYHEAGGKIFESAKYTGPTGTEIKKTPTEADLVARRNAAVNEAQEARAKAIYGVTGGGTPHYDEQRGVWSLPPSPINPTGKIANIPGVVPIDKPLTEAQGNATAFGMRMAQSDKIINELEDSGFDLAAPENLLAHNRLANAFAKPDAQKLYAAKLNFMTADLRKESGASISPSEFESEDKKYFPQPFDSQETKEQKRQARALARRAMAVQAGPVGAKNLLLNDVPPDIQDALRRAEEAKKAKGG